MSKIRGGVIHWQLGVRAADGPLRPNQGQTFFVKWGLSFTEVYSVRGRGESLTFFIAHSQRAMNIYGAE